MSTYFAVHFHRTSAISLCHHPWESGKPLGVDAPCTFVVNFLYTNGGWRWRCCRFSFTVTWLWTLLVPTPNEQKKGQTVFSPFLLPKHQRRLVSLQCRQKVSVRKPTDQSESNSKPSTNQTKVVKRKSNRARELKVCVYFVVIQIPPFIYWTCGAGRRGVRGHGWGDRLQPTCWVTQQPPVSQKSVFTHFAYGDAAIWLKCVRHPKNAIFVQNFAMSATPGWWLDFQYWVK